MSLCVFVHKGFKTLARHEQQSIASYNKQLHFTNHITNHKGPTRFGMGGLGIRKNRVRQALHNPDAEDAVVLYTPPPLTPEEQADPEMK